jgi:penicillin-binding protein 2
LKCWFYCYGPFEAPRYVTCVVVEGGVWGGTTTAPIAQEIMSRLFAMDKGATENISFLQPAIGNFNGLGAVDTTSNPNSAPTPAATPAKPGDVTAPADNPDDNDASVTAPAADAPPTSARSSNSGTKFRH